MSDVPLQPPRTSNDPASCVQSLSRRKDVRTPTPRFSDCFLPSSSYIESVIHQLLRLQLHVPPAELCGTGTTAGGSLEEFPDGLERGTNGSNTPLSVAGK